MDGKEEYNKRIKEVFNPPEPFGNHADDHLNAHKEERDNHQQFRNKVPFRIVFGYDEDSQYFGNKQSGQQGRKETVLHFISQGRQIACYKEQYAGKNC